MLLNLVNDMDKALDDNCYFAALSIALMLPDICGKAEFPNENSSKKRYVEWYDMWIGKHECSPREKDETVMPYLSGEVVYQLRCAFLHQGNPNIDKDKIIAPENKIDEFELIIESKQEFDIYCDSSCVSNLGRSYSVHIRRLCMIIGLSVKAYYRDNKGKFNFFKYKITDLDIVNSFWKRIQGE